VNGDLRVNGDDLRSINVEALEDLADSVLSDDTRRVLSGDHDGADGSSLTAYFKMKFAERGGATVTAMGGGLWFDLGHSPKSNGHRRALLGLVR
jgi:hypothetical protein